MSIIYRPLSSSGDYQLGLSAGSFLSGAAAVAQAITTNLKLLLGEWFEDVSLGTPLFQSILGVSGTPANVQSIDLIVRSRILSTQGVAAITAFTSSYANRTYSCTVTVSTVGGGTATVTVGF